MDNRIIVSGCIKDTPDSRDHIKVGSPLKMSETYSDSFSLKTLAPRARDQLSSSSCSGFAAASAMYILINKLNKKVNDLNISKNFDLSPMFIYWNARKIRYPLEGDNYLKKHDEGVSLRDTMQALKSKGVIPEEMMPFNSSLSVFKAPKWENIDVDKNFKIKEYLRIPQDSKAYELYKNVLSVEKLPIIAGIILYDEQMDEMDRTGIMYPVKNKNKAECIGGHAVCVTGFCTIKEQPYIEFLNSWGSRYGDNGYCYFPAAFLFDPFYTLDSWTFSKNYF